MEKTSKCEMGNPKEDSAMYAWFYNEETNKYFKVS